MKLKAFILTASTAICALTGQSQIVNILSENFNNGFPIGWQSIDGDQRTPATAVSDIGTSFSAHVDYDTLTSGDSILVATSWFNPIGMANNYLILPQVTLQANGNFLLFEAKSKDPSYPESFEILISTTLGDTVSLVDTLYSEDLLSPNWTQYILDLDAYVNQSIYIAIHHSSNDKFILCLDNFYVYADLQNSVQELESNSAVSIYPNPTSDLLTVKAENAITSLTIYDASGKLIYTENSSSNQQQIQLDLNAYPLGFYVLDVLIDGKNIRKKFIKN